MAAFNLPRHVDDGRNVSVPPLVAPHLSVDGWTLAGTPLANRVPPREAGELTALLHCISMRVETPWTYERAAQLLEECGEPAQALAACEAYLALPTARPAKVRGLVRRRNRLRMALAS